MPESAAAALILLANQPLIITTAHLEKLLHGWQSAPLQIVASQYHRSVGAPALFPARFFEHLLTLRGDRDAKPLLKQFENSLLKIPLPEAELDINSKEDFGHFRLLFR